MLKSIIIGSLLALLATAEDLCPQSTQQACQSDITKAYQVCEKAAKEKGKDQQADINCVKYFTAMRKDCWPCVCEIAKDEGWKIKGCDTWMKAAKYIRSD